MHVSRLFIILITAALWSPAGQAAPAKFTYQGQIIKPTGQALEGNNVTFTIEVLSPGVEECLLYEESHVLNMTNSNGVFALTVGEGSRSGADYEDLGPNDLAKALSNSTGVITPTTCASVGSYTPTADHGRKLRVTFDDGTGPQTLTENHNIVSVPYASNAASIGGLTPSDLLNINTTGSYVLTQANLQNVFDGANHTELLALIAGSSSQYLQSSPSGDFSMNSNKITNVATPTAANDAANKNYVDNSIGGAAADNTTITGLAAGQSGHVMYWDGTQWTAGAPAGDSTKLALAGGTMSGAINMGNQNITNANDIAAGNDVTIGRDLTVTRNADVTGNVAVTGTISANGVSTTGTLGIYNADNSYMGFQTPPGSADLIWTLPAADGSANQVLTTDGSGQLVWANDNAPVASVFGRTGPVTADTSDYDAIQIDNTAAGNIAATNVQAAINELDADKVAKAGDLMTGALTMNATNEVRFADSDNSHYVGFKAPNAISAGASFVWELPTDDGTSGQVLQTNGSGVLSWSTLAAVGETNTAANVGSGAGQIFRDKTSTTINLKTINAGSTKLSVTNNADDITLNVVDANIDHDALNNFAANEHVDHSSVSIATAADSGLSGGGDLTSTRNLALDITGTTDLGAAVDNADSLIIYDASGTALREATRAELVLSETEVDNYVSDNNFIEQNGNSFTSAMTIGTNDNNILNFKTNNSIGMTLDTSGLLGVGTTTPASQLHVSGGNLQVGEASMTSGNPTFSLFGYDSGATASQYGRLSVDTAGNFSIVASDNYLILDSAAYVQTQKPINMISHTLMFSGNHVLNSADAGATLILGDGGGTTGIRIGNGATTQTTIPSGNVGIGTTTPAGALEIGSGQILLPDGTSGAPSVAFSSDTDTGLFRNAANNLSISAGGSAQLLVGTSGNTLYGTTRIGAADTSLYRQAAGSIRTGGDLTVDGSLGIGTTAPSGKLDVDGDVRMLGATSGYAGFQAPAVGPNVIWTLPTADGSNGQVLETNGSGVLQWRTLSAVGETNDGANVGAGAGQIYRDKTGTTINLKTIAAGSTRLSVTNNANDVTLDVTEANIDHDSLSGFVANEHVDHSSVNITTAADSGLSGGGDLTSTRNLSVNIPGTTDLGTAADGADTLLIYDATATVLREVTRTQLVLSETEVDDFVADNGYAFDADKVNRAGDTMTGNLNIDNAQEMQFSEADGSGANYVGFKAPATLAGNQIWTLPVADGSSGHLLSTDGSGVLSWVAAPSGLPAGMGSQANPSINFSTSTSTGLYNDGPNSIGFSTAGSRKWSLGSAGRWDSGVTGVATIQRTTTETSPTFAFTGDENTGLYRPAADQLGLVTNATEKLRIDASGNVGVGTTTPNEKLTLEGGMSFKEMTAPTTDVATYHKLYVDSADNDLKFRDESGTVTNLLASGGDILSDGSVDMTANLKTPGIESPSSSTQFLSFNGSSVTLQQGAGDNIVLTSTGTYIGAGSGAYFNHGNSAVAPVVASFAQRNTGLFFPAADEIGLSSDGTETVRIDSSGNMGIGTNSPARLLHVDGPMRMTASALPSSPIAGDMAIDSGDSNKLKFYNGSSWVDTSGGGGTGDFLRDGSLAMTGNLDIGANKITNGGAGSGIELTSSGIPALPGGVLYMNQGISDLNNAVRLSGSQSQGVVQFSRCSSATCGSYSPSFRFDMLNRSISIGGYANPQYDLELFGNATIGPRSTGSTANTLTLAAGDTAGGVADRPGGTLYLKGGESNGTGTSEVHIQTASAGSTGTTMNSSTTKVVIKGSGNVGIGSTAPEAKLDVQGQIRSKSHSQSTAAIDWDNGNAITTSFNCGSNITFANMLDGASYTLVVTGTGTSQCNFSTTVTGNDAATVSYRFKPANGTRTASSHTVYSLLRVGSTVYVSWISDF